MKLRISLVILVSFLFHLAYSCTFIPDSFCRTTNILSNNLVVNGYISSVDSDGINFEIIQVLRGQETKSNIRIWDGTDFDCNGPFSMAAADFGTVDDTLILVLPMIDSLENTWDVLGDYRRPNSYTKSPILFVQNNVVKGYISGNLSSFDYTSFVDSWFTEQDCDAIVSTDNIVKKTNLEIFPNPASSVLTIQGAQGIKASRINIHDIYGNVVLSKEINTSSNVISILDLPAGIYFISMPGLLEPKNFVKI